jgi:hypothetical protein
LCFGVRDLTRIGEFGGDFLEVVELGDIGFIANRYQHEVSTFLGFADAENLHARGSLGEFIVVMVNILRVGEDVRRSDDVSKDFLGRRHCR